MTTPTFVKLLVLFLVVVLPILLMQVWRKMDEQADAASWTQLASAASGTLRVFDPAMVQALPEAARRYFLFTIAPGTPLHTVSEIRMHGEIGLGSRERPNYMPMRARQILAPPYGFVWRLEAAAGIRRMSGSDGMVEGRSWTRFWFDWLMPVRAGGNDDHLRASFGRVVAEAVFWAPASLLPGNEVRWTNGEKYGRARAIVTRGSLVQELEIEIAEDGHPLWVKIPRWSNANPEKRWRLQPFGGTLSEFRNFDGFTLPTRVDGGNYFDTQDYFPFFRAHVECIRFP
jgi:hypothetical protein